MMPKPRPFQTTQLRTRFRGWQLIATARTVTGIKGKATFEIKRGLVDFEAALRAGKAEVNQREGVEKWIEGYENEALR